MSEIRKLTWKYFWQQKWKEVKGPLTMGSVLIGILFLLFGLGFPGGPEVHSIKLLIIGGAILGFWILIGILGLIELFCKWIKSNWQTATERAISELTVEGLIRGTDSE